MAVGFPDFEVSSGSFPYPLKAVRDSIGPTYEEKTVSGARQVRSTLELIFHVQINSYSTTALALATYITTARVDDPVLMTSRTIQGPTGPVTTLVGIQHSGQWNVRDIDIQDEGDGTTTVITSLQRELQDWHAQS